MDLRQENEAHGRRRPMDCQDIYVALGFKPTAHLPKAGHTGTMIDNVFVWVLPKTDKPQDAARVWCACPHCGRGLTAGKLRQHMIIHKGK